MNTLYAIRDKKTQQLLTYDSGGYIAWYESSKPTVTADLVFLQEEMNNGDINLEEYDPEIVIIKYTIESL